MKKRIFFDENVPEMICNWGLTLGNVGQWSPEDKVAALLQNYYKLFFSHKVTLDGISRKATLAFVVERKFLMSIK